MSIYEIIYDYDDERNICETFEGDWGELQDYIKTMRKQGCYNISANCISGD